MQEQVRLENLIQLCLHRKENVLSFLSDDFEPRTSKQQDLNMMFLDEQWQQRVQ